MVTPSPHPLERELGLECYLSDAPGIGGRLRAVPEDFQVEELSLEPPEAPTGEYAIAQVRSKNWETNRLVRRLSKNLQISRNRVGFAGMKDKLALSTRLMSFRAPLELVQQLEIPDVEILRAYQAARPLRIGDLLGNRFTIRIREIEPGRAEAALRTVAAELGAVGGFPNYFGIQRFGVVRPITHTVGELLVRGEYEQAVWTYIANPMEEENERAREARARLEATRDIAAALGEFPPTLSFERTLLAHLHRRPEDWVGALSCLPRNLLMMFVHAYQSQLFNRMISARLRAGLRLHEPVVGDRILPQDRRGLPDHRGSILVREENLQMIVQAVRDGKAWVSGLLFGARSSFAEGPMGEIERRIVEAERLKPDDFVISGLPAASSDGSRRELLASCPDLAWTLEEGQGSAVFTFSLRKGAYATVLLREFTKGDPRHL